MLKYSFKNHQKGAKPISGLSKEEMPNYFKNVNKMKMGLFLNLINIIINFCLNKIAKDNSFTDLKF